MKSKPRITTSSQASCAKSKPFNGAKQQTLPLPQLPKERIIAIRLRRSLHDLGYIIYSAGAIETLIDVIVYRSKVIIIDSARPNDPDYLIQKSNEKHVYTLDASPMTLPKLLEHPISCGKEYFVSYEMFPSTYSPDYSSYNSYGLSESIGAICFKEVDKDYDITPVGKPHPLWDVKLVDENSQKPCTGEIGELIFEQKYLRGYIKRMDFFNQVCYDGNFHSGDLSFYNDADDIVIVGRKKDIKKTPEGYIVPIFISNAIKKAFPDIQECCVIIYDSKMQDEKHDAEHSKEQIQIVAYYISEDVHTLEELIAGITDTIPAYFLPTHALKLEQFEYFFCGKLNRNLFPRPE